MIPTLSLPSEDSIFKLDKHIRLRLLENPSDKNLITKSQRARRERMKRSLSKACANESTDESMLSMEPLKMVNRIENNKSMRKHDESECLSKIDDLEIDRYLHNEEERRYKKIIWEKLNWDYLKDQAAKEEAAQKGIDASASVATVQKGKTKRQTQVAKGSGSVQLDLKAIQASRKKSLSSKVNFEMVEKLFGESDPLKVLENPKKARFEPCKNRGDDEPESRGEFEEEADEMGGLYENTYDDNVDEGYNYQDDDYNF